ncbi:glycosyltransferase family 4 protein [Micrococcus luteus]|uniref:glycosyltransferase family 4 protein n=1 Tax=Micrococcus luteus TaxID=1270 RepID=UPI00343486DC
MSARIWIAANQGKVGGGEVMLHHIATALRELGRDVAVVAPAEPSAVASRLAADGFPVDRVGGPGRTGYMRALRGWHSSHREDVVWCNGLLPATALAGRPRRIVHLHQWLIGPRDRVLGTLAMRGALAVLAPSESVAREIPGCRVLHNWVPRPVPLSGTASARRLPGEGGALRVGYLGRLSFDKGFHLLMDVAEELHREQPDEWRFIVAGEPRFTTEDDAREIGKRLAASRAVTARGWQAPGDFLPTVDVLVVPSLAPESFGLVAAEAMAAGVPVAVSDTGALPEVAGDDHPLLFECDNHEELAAALRRAREMDLASVAAAQHRRWEALFSPEAGQAALTTLLKELHV